MGNLGTSYETFHGQKFKLSFTITKSEIQSMNFQTKQMLIQKMKWYLYSSCHKHSKWKIKLSRIVQTTKLNKIKKRKEKRIHFFYFYVWALTWTGPVFYLEEPCTLSLLPPVVGGHESPVVEALPRDISCPLSQEGGFGVSGWSQVDLDLTSPVSSQRYPSLNMLEISHITVGALAAIRVQGDDKFSIHWNLAVRNFK